MPRQVSVLTESSERYIPADSAAFFRAQAYRAWAVAVAIVLVWVAAVVAAPWARESGVGLAGPIYSFFSYICHQLPDRSLHLGSEPLAVCSRCFGVYFGLLIGLLAYPFWRRVEDVDPLPRTWLFLSLVPITIDWSLTIFGIWENTHLSRFLTGLALGVACATYIVPAVVEIRRNVSLRRRAAA